MNKSEQLIACLEGEIAKRDEELAACRVAVENCEVFRAELAAIKTQEPVARLPACPSRAFAVANLRDLAQSVLQHDPDVGMFRDEDQAFLINELADLAESFNGDVKLYAAPVSEAKAQGVVILDESQEAAEFESQFQGCKAFMRDSNASEAAGKYVCQRSHMFKVWMHFRAMLAPPAAPAADAGVNDHDQ